MCFHSRQTKNAVTAEKRFNAIIRDTLKFQPSDHYNGFSYPETPVITSSNHSIIEHFKWGLIPYWSKDDAIKQFTLNAKIETLTEKPSFKSSVNQRCLVIADGFYEWQWLDSKGKQKQKYLITLPEETLFAFAGIWSQWTDTSSGKFVHTYSIVTTEARGIMREIHNSKLRMPVILSPENELDWLQNKPLNQFFQPNLELVAQKC